jgi:hypothetical protein
VAVSVDVEDDKRVGGITAHCSETVLERLGRIADPQYQQIAVVGF